MGSANLSQLWFLPGMGFQYLGDLYIRDAKVSGIRNIEALNWNAASQCSQMIILTQRWVRMRQTRLLYKSLRHSASGLLQRDLTIRRSIH